MMEGRISYANINILFPINHSTQACHPPSNWGDNGRKGGWGAVVKGIQERTLTGWVRGKYGRGHTKDGSSRGLGFAGSSRRCGQVQGVGGRDTPGPVCVDIC